MLGKREKRTKKKEFSLKKTKETKKEQILITEKKELFRLEAEFWRIFWERRMLYKSFLLALGLPELWFIARKMLWKKGHKSCFFDV